MTQRLQARIHHQKCNVGLQGLMEAFTVIVRSAQEPFGEPVALHQSA